MCVQDIDAVIQYYEIFKRKKQNGEHNLKVATIFSFGQNEDEMEDVILLNSLWLQKTKQNMAIAKPHRREVLEHYVEDFNERIGEKTEHQRHRKFLQLLQCGCQKIEAKRSGYFVSCQYVFDRFQSKHLNTLYVDKNLQYHGLIQAFSRTNRILDKNKTQGNIVCFRNLKDKTDEAIALFKNKEAIDEMIVEPYEKYVEQFNEAVEKLLTIVPEVKSVDGLFTEEDQLQFILAFCRLNAFAQKNEPLLRIYLEDLQMEEHFLRDYTSKYLDFKERLVLSFFTRKNFDSVMILILNWNLIRRDTINVTYIVQVD